MQKFALSTIIEDKDWDPLYVINWKCFKDLPEIAAFSPGGLDPSRREANIRGFKYGAFGGLIERAYAKITECESGDITSYVSCRVYRGSKGIIDGDLAKPPPPEKLPMVEDLKDREFFEWFWTKDRAEMRELKELHVPHVYVQAIATDPTWQRHGAATMLMQWVFEFAVKEKIRRCALQAAPATVKSGFYQKLGFHAVYTHTFVDDERFPGREGTTYVTMTRDF